MHDTNAIWNSLAETGKAYGYINDTLWGQLLDEAREEGVVLECRLLQSGVNAVFLVDFTVDCNRTIH